MNFLPENKKYYFYVMITELIMLSCIYWFFFNLMISSCLVYVLSVGFYVTAYRFWIRKFNKKEHLLIDNGEHFIMINLIFLSFILVVNSLITSAFYNNMLYVYLLIFIIFISYYFYRIKKQKNSLVLPEKISTTTKTVIVMSCIFLSFDFVVYLTEKLNIQLVLYLPFLFLILTFLLFIYKKVFLFKSFFAVILFFNVYIMSTILLVLNCLHNNFFPFTLIIHFTVFLSVISLMNANSTEIKEYDFTDSKEVMSLLFTNVVLIFVSLNNILSFQRPAIFVSYAFFVTILFISYIIYHNYKMYVN